MDRSCTLPRPSASHLAASGTPDSNNAVENAEKVAPSCGASSAVPSALRPPSVSLTRSPSASSSSSIVLLSCSDRGDDVSEARQDKELQVNRPSLLAYAPPPPPPRGDVSATDSLTKPVRATAASSPSLSSPLHLTQERLAALGAVDDFTSRQRDRHRGDDALREEEEGNRGTAHHNSVHRRDRGVDWLNTAAAPSSTVGQQEVHKEAIDGAGCANTDAPSPPLTPPQQQPHARLFAPADGPDTGGDHDPAKTPEAANREPLWCSFDVVTPVRQTRPRADPYNTEDGNAGAYASPPPRLSAQGTFTSSSTSTSTTATPAVYAIGHHRSRRCGADTPAAARTAPVPRRSAPDASPPFPPSSFTQRPADTTAATTTAATTPRRGAPFGGTSASPPPRVSLGRPSPLAVFLTPPPPASSPLTVVRELRHRTGHAHHTEMAADALTRGQKTPRGDCWAGLASNGDDHHHRNADATAEAQQSLTPQALHARAAAASTSGATNAEGTTHNITLRICTLSGFTLRVVVDRRLPVSQLADRVAQYIHVHRAHVQLKYTKTGAVFDAVSAVAPEEAATAVNTTRSPSSATTTSLRLCDLPNLADADVFLVLLRPQATTSADPSLLSSSFLPPSRGFDQRSPAASRQVAKRQRTSGGGSGHSTATRKSGAAPAASAPSSLSASSPPHRTSFPSPLSPRRPSASAARRSSIADNNDGSVEVDRSGGGAGGLTATVQSGGREFMRGSYGFPPLMGASTASSARASSPPPPPPPPLR